MPPDMRVTHISIVHKPLDTRIFRKQCRALVAAGHEVHLVVGGPPAQQLQGVRLHRISLDSGRPPARQQWARFLRAAGHALRLRPSIYHLHDPHLIPLGVLLKLFGCAVVYDVHEDYPGHARSKLHARPVRGRVKAGMWRVLERVAARTLDRFVCASPALTQGFPPARTVVVRNLPIHRDFAIAAADDSVLPYRARPNRVVYTGYMHEIRGLWDLASALQLLPADLDCNVRLVGAFRPPKLIEEVRLHPGWERMDPVRWQPHEQIVRELLAARIGLILLHPLPNHHDPLRSNKLFEYMAAGIPVVATDLPAWRQIVHDVGCGLVVDVHDPSAIAASIQWLLEHPEEAEAMGERGKAAVWREFNWDGDELRLLELYARLTGDPPRLAEPPAEPAAETTRSP
jgi:glycosyltransferase involved in cell wall biosynthesis